MLAEASANVLDIEHRRTDRDLHVDEVEVLVHLETRGPDHAAQVIEALTGASYAVTAL